MDAGHWSSLSRKPCVERFLAHKRRVTSLKVSPDVRDQLVPRPWPQNRGDFFFMPAILGENQTIQMYDTVGGRNPAPVDM